MTPSIPQFRGLLEENIVPVNRQACLPSSSEPLLPLGAFAPPLEPLLPSFWQPWTTWPRFRGLVCFYPDDTDLSVLPGFIWVADCSYSFWFDARRLKLALLLDAGSSTVTMIELTPTLDDQFCDAFSFGLSINYSNSIFLQSYSKNSMCVLYCSDVSRIT